MLIYIVGYGRNGSTIISLKLDDLINCVNLGEAKYIIKGNKDDIIDPYWKKFKQEMSRSYIETKDIQRTESLFGIFRSFENKKKHLDFWRIFFQKVEHDCKIDTFIDTSKTTLDSLFRPYLLKNIFGDKILLIHPRKPVNQVFKSLLKGKNSDLERNLQKPQLKVYMHSIFIGMPHYFITEILTRLIYRRSLKRVYLKSADRDIKELVKKYKLPIKQNKKANHIPMVYGNRLRNKYS